MTKSSKIAPYISFVATSRNDNHGGDMRKRMRIFTNGLRHQCNKFKLHCELILVDWNSPNPQEGLDTILPHSKEGEYLKIRFIKVPDSIHQTYNYSDRLGLYQMIAKNVGIRRAEGDFVVCTNVDLLFSDALFERLVKRDLKKGVFYRANRCDIPNSINEKLSVEEQLLFADQNVIKRLGNYPEYPIFEKPEGIFIDNKMFHWMLPVLSRLKHRMKGERKSLELSIDFDACGDFTLMSKQDWLAINGYPELQMYSLHIDSMALFEALAKGMKQEIFPQAACTYHIAHDGGWEQYEPIDKIRFYERLPSLEYSTVWEAGFKIIEEKGTFGINDSNWGLNEVQLKEV